MIEYNARVEYADADLDPDDLIEAMAEYHPAIARTPTQEIEAYITIPAGTLDEAITAALRIAREAVATQVQVQAVEVMPTAIFDARNGIEYVPTLVSVTEAAQTLGITRTSVQQRIDAGKLPAVKVGATWAIPQSALATASA